MFTPKGSHIKPAAYTTMLLALGLVMGGCRNPRASHTPPTNAYVLSGGKIKYFIPTPGLPSSPADEAMLMACQQLPVTSSTARSGFLVLTAGQFGRVPLHALVVGKQVLMLPTDFGTIGITSSSSNDSRGFILYPTSAQRITFIIGTKDAYVGSTKIALEEPIVQIQRDKQLVMLLSDIQSVFRERDRQRHQTPFLRDMKIIYDIRDYHR